MLSQSLNRLWVCLLIFLFGMLAACRSGSPREHVEINGSTYEYQRENQPINDLRRDLFDTQVLRTQHCKIQYSLGPTSNMGTLVMLSEECYKQVAKDLDFDVKADRPIILFLSRSDYAAVTSDQSGAFTPNGPNDTGDSVYINIDKFPPDSDRLAEVVRHELSHFVCSKLRRTIMGRLLGRKPPDSRSLWALEEAIAQFEEPRADSAAELLGILLQGQPFISFEQMDLSTAPGSKPIAIQEMRLFLDMVTERYGARAVARLAHCANLWPMRKVIAEAFAVSDSDIELQFFEYMTKRVAEMSSQTKPREARGRNEPSLLPH